MAHLKATVPKAANCPVVAFGGSYGGTLTTFLRAKVKKTSSWPRSWANFSLF
jgi:hypothetical protein